MWTLKPGYKTTELLVTVLSGVGFLVAALSGDLSPHWAAIATAVSTGLYSLSRGLAKLNPPKSVEPVGGTTVTTPPPVQ